MTLVVRNARQPRPSAFERPSFTCDTSFRRTYLSKPEVFDRCLRQRPLGLVDLQARVLSRRMPCHVSLPSSNPEIPAKTNPLPTSTSAMRASVCAMTTDWGPTVSGHRRTPTKTVKRPNYLLSFVDRSKTPIFAIQGRRMGIEYSWGFLPGLEGRAEYFPCAGVDRREGMADSASRARALVAKGEKKLSGWSMFGNKYEDAASMFESAANQFKLAKECAWERSEKETSVL